MPKTGPNRLSRRAATSVSFLTIALAACLSPSHTTLPEAMPMQVEVDVFSGSPNPRWDLSPQQAEDLLQRVRTLSATEGEADPEGGLGYRGLIIRGPGVDRAGYDELVVGGGVVVVRGRQGARRFADVGRSVERWVLQTGKGRIEADLYDYLSSEVGPG